MLRGTEHLIFIYFEGSNVVKPTHLTCEFCGTTDLAEKFPRSKRFCSVSCSKRFSAYSQRNKQSVDSGQTKGTVPVKGVKRVVSTEQNPLHKVNNLQKSIIIYFELHQFFPFSYSLIYNGALVISACYCQL